MTDSAETPDWVRLQKALSIEAERGFTDLMGKQYRFSEFLCLSFGKVLPVNAPPSERRRWQEMAAEFARYPQLTLPQRQHLVADARRFLQQLKQALEAPPEPPRPKLPRTTPVQTLHSTSGRYQGKSSLNRPVTLDQPLSELAEVGRGKSSYLERLGLLKVRDLLFYYPRDHIDYARQVSIANLTPGETVTLVGTVKRCNCFTSPKNNKLTIFLR